MESPLCLAASLLLLGATGAFAQFSNTDAAADHASSVHAIKTLPRCGYSLMQLPFQRVQLTLEQGATPSGLVIRYEASEKCKKYNTIIVLSEDLKANMQRDLASGSAFTFVKHFGLSPEHAADIVKGPTTVETLKHAVESREFKFGPDPQFSIWAAKTADDVKKFGVVFAMFYPVDGT